MNHKILILCVAALLGSHNQSFGQLGKTFLQCQEQYGKCKVDKDNKPVPITPKPIKGKFASGQWKQGDFQIQIAWLPPDGAKGAASYVRITNTAGPLTQEQIEKVLAANGGGWKLGEPKAASLEGYTYYRNDGSKSSPMLKGMPYITLKSAKLVQLEKAAKEKTTNPK